MRQYTIAPEAMKDLQEIIDYFAQRNVEAGEILLSKFAI